MTRRIVICCDGTWNTPDRSNPTNVVKLARSITPVSSDGTSQIVFYDLGVGTGPWLDRYTGGALGMGLVKNIEDAYRFLIHNYEPGDDVFLFGFSRGAYTARSLAGLIRNVGLLHKTQVDEFQNAFALYRRKDAGPESSEARAFRNRHAREIDIHFVGVWDTVGALGIPLGGLRWLTRRKHGFHDVELSRGVKNGFHALAIDEKRGSFKPSLWMAKKKEGQVVEQVWFAGAHSDVGGGYYRAGLSDMAFDWMKEKAEGCGLAFDEEYVESIIHVDHLSGPHDSKKGLFKFTRGYHRILGDASGGTEAVHPGIDAKFKAPEMAYRPDNLARYLADPDHRIAVTKWKVPGDDSEGDAEDE
ncbi:MAG: DUF2235 domain-containing protein [Dehalococcoidia bacterium]|nr:DUF2235 domain-containing protein [Dehalococcoidia bacterium]